MVKEEEEEKSGISSALLIDKLFDLRLVNLDVI